MSKYNSGDKVEPGTIEKYSLQLSLKEDNKSVSNFIAFLKAMDEKIITDGVENSKAWFKKSYTRDVLQELYTPMINYPKDKDTGEINPAYPPTYKLSIPVQDSRVLIDCYNEQKEKVELKNIPKGSKVIAILKLQGIWFAGSKFGCSAKVVQMVVNEPETMSGFCFSDDEDEDDDVTVAIPKSTLVDSSDEEEGEVKKFEPVEEEEIEVEAEAEAEQEEVVTEEVVETSAAKKKRGKK